MYHRILSHRTLALLTVLVASPALAQMPPSTPAAMSAASPMGEQPGPNVERRIGDLKTKLVVTAAQEP